MQMNELIMRVHQATERDLLCELALTQLPVLLEADYVCWNIISADPFLADFRANQPWYECGLLLLPALNATVDTHPIVAHLSLQDGEAMDGVYALSDFVSQRELRDRAIYQEGYRELEADYQLMTQFVHSDCSGVILTVNSRRPITDRARTILEVLRAHFEIACQRLQIAKAAEAALAALTATQIENWRDTLSRREFEVACLLTKGLRNTDIATRLGISVRTVEKHVERALYKLRFCSRQELMAATLHV